MDLFLNLIRGFSMALADSVPGVSGRNHSLFVPGDFMMNSSVPFMS